jgi:hypothetical protein
MLAAFLNFAVGFFWLAVCTGAVSVLLRPLHIHAPPHWHFPLALLTGVAVIDSFVMLLLFLIGGVPTLRLVGGLLLGFGAYGVIRYLNALETLGSQPYVVVVHAEAPDELLTARSGEAPMLLGCHGCFAIA